MAPNLLPKFHNYLKHSNEFEPTRIGHGDPLLLDSALVGNKTVRMVYAPFDHVNHSAQIVIVGMTPGASQAQRALRAASIALRNGKSLEQAGAKAKVYASFSGEPMRGNLIAMLDQIGVAELLRLPTTADLWGHRSDLVHFTSALRYPVFVDGKNWSGNPDMVRTPKLRDWLTNYTGAELKDLSNALIVPLGLKVSAAMQHLASAGLIERDRVLDGLPHPSGANQERINYFLGRKPAGQLSAKTNAETIDSARGVLVKRIARLRS